MSIRDNFQSAGFLRRENRTIVFLLILAIAVGFEGSIIAHRIQLSDERRYDRCVNFDKPNVAAIRRFMVSLHNYVPAGAPSHAAISAAAAQYLLDTANVAAKGCEGIPDATVPSPGALQ